MSFFRCRDNDETVNILTEHETWKLRQYVVKRLMNDMNMIPFM